MAQEGGQVVAALPRAADGADHVGELAELFDVGAVELLGQDDVKRPVVAVEGGDAMGGVGSGNGRLGRGTRGVDGLHGSPSALGHAGGGFAGASPSPSAGVS